MNQNFNHLFLSDDHITGLCHRCRYYSLCRRKPVPNPVKGSCALMQSFVNGSVHIGCCNAEVWWAVCVVGVFPHHAAQQLCEVWMPLRPIPDPFAGGVRPDQAAIAFGLAYHSFGHFTFKQRDTSSASAFEGGHSFG
jgi:hypothetical protein